MSSMWDDFLDFDLRREDFVYKLPGLTWGYLYNKYSFISFLGEKLDKRCDLIKHMAQQNGMNPVVNKSWRHRKNKRINAEWIPVKYITKLTCAIKEKEKLKSYLERHYEKISKEHGKVEMITLSFHLPEMIRPSRRKFDTKFQLALKTLKEKFDKLKKQIQSDRFYTQVCGYSKLILLTEKCEPFYLVNFFVKCKKGVDIDSDNIACHISDLWQLGESTHERDHWKLLFYPLGESNLPFDDNIKLTVVKPTELSRVVHEPCSEDKDILDIIFEPTDDERALPPNNRRGCFEFFLIQAQQYNVIPGIRACSTSTNLTYMNARVIKARQARKNVHKKT